MSNIFAYLSDSCPFCLKMDFAIILHNLPVPVQEEIETIWSGDGDPRENKLVEIFGNQVPLPTMVKEGEVREVMTGVFGNPSDRFKLNLIDNLKIIESLTGERRMGI